jgi:hypothetical protein
MCLGSSWDALSFRGRPTVRGGRNMVQQEHLGLSALAIIRRHLV